MVLVLSREMGKKRKNHNQSEQRTEAEAKKPKSDFVQYLTKLSESGGVDEMKSNEVAVRVVFEDSKDQEMDVLTDSQASAVISALIPSVPWELTDGFRSVFQAAEDQYSRVEEALIASIPHRNGEGIDYLLSRLETAFTDLNAAFKRNDLNFFCRQCVKSAAELWMSAQCDKSRLALERITKEILKIEKISEHLKTVVGSALFQCFVAASPHLDASIHAEMFSFLITYFTSCKLTSKVNIRLLAVSLVSAGSHFPQLWPIVSTHLTSLASTDFILGEILVSAPTEQFSLIFESVAPLLSRSSPNSLKLTSDAVLAKKMLQGEFIKFLKRIYDCTESNLLQCVLYNNSPNELAEKRLTTLVGAQICSNLVQFHRPMKFVEPLTSSKEFLGQLSSDPKGSQVLRSIFNSSLIGLKTKHKIISELIGRASSLAHDKFGSYTLELLWSYASPPLRLEIISELHRRSPNLSTTNNKFASIVCYKIGFNLYAKDPKKWERVHLIEKK